MKTNPKRVPISLSDSLQMNEEVQMCLICEFTRVKKDQPSLLK